MNKDKLTAIKKKLQTEAPHIISIAVASAAVAVVFRQKTKNYFKLSEGDMVAMKTGDTEMRFSLHGNDYAMRHIGNTPEEN